MQLAVLTTGKKSIVGDTSLIFCISQKGPRLMNVLATMATPEMALFVPWKEIATTSRSSATPTQIVFQHRADGNAFAIKVSKEYFRPKLSFVQNYL